MLVLSRKPGEQVEIGEGIFVTVVSVRGHRVKLGIEAPLSVPVRRVEIDLSDMPEHFQSRFAPTPFCHQ